MLISKTAFGESVYCSVVLDGYCQLDLFMTFRKLSSILNEVISKCSAICHSSFFQAIIDTPQFSK